jgi:predicted nucleic-acid-binding Zn-ribbon protein
MKKTLKLKDAEWKLTGFMRCTHCGYTEEYPSHALPEDDSCPACRTTNYRRQVLVGETVLMDYDPTIHSL